MPQAQAHVQQLAQADVLHLAQAQAHPHAPAEAQAPPHPQQQAPPKTHALAHRTPGGMLSLCHSQESRPRAARKKPRQRKVFEGWPPRAAVLWWCNAVVQPELRRCTQLRRPVQGGLAPA
jgi:hypothetical protein